MGRLRTHWWMFLPGQDLKLGSEMLEMYSFVNLKGPCVLRITERTEEELLLRMTLGEFTITAFIETSHAYK